MGGERRSVLRTTKVYRAAAADGRATSVAGAAASGRRGLLGPTMPDVGMAAAGAGAQRKAGATGSGRRPHRRSSGDLQVSSVAEVYGPQRLADPPALLAGFRERLADALRDGYTGLRVVADNSAMLDGPERAEAWRRWEPVADMFMAAYPVTGVCAFDDERVDPEILSAVLALHHPTDS